MYMSLYFSETGNTGLRYFQILKILQIFRKKVQENMNLENLSHYLLSHTLFDHIANYNVILPHCQVECICSNRHGNFKYFEHCIHVYLSKL